MKRSVFILYFTLMFLSVFSITLYANESISYYYVAPWGNDSSPEGSMLKPFKTINKALEFSEYNQNLSYIYVEEGTYTENVVFKNQKQYVIGGVIDLNNPGQRDGVSIIVPEDPALPTVLLYYGHIEGFTIQGGYPSVLLADKETNGIQSPVDTSVSKCRILDSTHCGILLGVTQRQINVSGEIKISNCEIDNATSSGIALLATGLNPLEEHGFLGATNLSVEIDRSTVTNSMYSGILFFCNQLEITECTVGLNHERGINGACSIQNADLIRGNVYIYNNSVRENGATGIFLDTPDGEITSNSIVANYGDGINCGAFNLFIVHNHIADNMWNGISARNPHLPPVAVYDPIIIDNVIERNHLNGVLATETAYCYLGSNLVRENSLSGLHATDYTTCIAEYNQISGNKNFGVVLSRKALPEISNNFLIWNFNGGILAQDSTGADIHENYICWNSGPGVKVSLKGAPSLNGNKIVSNNDSGVLCQGLSSPQFDNYNVIWGNRRGGIKVIDHASPSFQKTLVCHNNLQGMELDDDASCTVNHTVLDQNFDHGILLRSRSKVLLKNSIISRTHGVGLSELSYDADPLEVVNNCFYHNEIGDYRDEILHTFKGAEQINQLVDNNGTPCHSNVSIDPRFVQWGAFSYSNPIHVDDDGTSSGDGSLTNPFNTLTDAMISYSYRLAEGSGIIAKGSDGSDIGAYPYTDLYPPQGSSQIKIILRPGTYIESNLVITPNVWIQGEPVALLSGHPDFLMLLPRSGSFIEGVKVEEAGVGIMILKEQTPWLRDIKVSHCTEGIVVNNASPQLTRCYINESALAGMRLFGASPIIEHNIIDKCALFGITCENGSSPLIVSNQISNTMTGISLTQNSSAQINNNSIAGCQEVGVYCNKSPLSSVEDNIIIDNGVGIKIEDGSSCTIMENVIMNSFMFGVQTTTNDVVVHIEKNIFRNNNWDGIRCENAQLLSVMNNLFIDNNDGIGLPSAATSYIVNNTFAYNRDDAITLSSFTGPVVNNNIMAYNEGYGIHETNAYCDPVSVKNNCIYENERGDYYDEGSDTYNGAIEVNSYVNNSPYPCEGNISENPLFVDAPSDNYHLSIGSPCIDNGITEFAPGDDIEGEDRPQGAGVDIGADEYYPAWTYDTVTNAEDWNFVAAPGVFNQPSAGISPAGITLTSHDNTNTFGYWSNNEKPFIIHNDNVYCAQFRVSTDVEDRTRVPYTRLRINTSDYKSYHSLLVTSVDPASCAPTIEGDTYELYFFPGQNSPEQVKDNKLRRGIISFDMLNFDPLDAAGATLTLEEVLVNRLPVEALGGATELAVFNFEEGAGSWLFSGATPEFTAPLTPSIPGGLALQAVNNFDTFGYWYMDSVFSTIYSDTLYCIEYDIKSNQTDKSRVPELRLRAYDERYQLVSDTGVKSVMDGGDSPDIEGGTYCLFYKSLPALKDSVLGLSFDLINCDTTDDAGGILFLDSVRVLSYPCPAFE